MIEIGIPIVDAIVNTFFINVSEISLYAISIAIYAIVIWHYYRLLARRDFFHFEETDGEGFGAWFKNFFEEIAFIFKYILFFPLISFIFFTLFSLMLFLLSKEQTIQQILFIGAAVIAATRITAYYNEDLSKDLAKMVPLALLGVFIVQADFFSTEILIARINELPNFMIEIASFILFFLVLEIVLRIVYGFVSVNKSDKLKRHEKIRSRNNVEKVKKEERDRILDQLEESV
ncbi:MAG: hypothetical protein WC915_03775 [archaeon]|jgi:hypothetical protein